MHPDLLHLGPLTVHSYGLMIVIGFLAGLYLIKLRLESTDLKWQQILDLAFYLLLAGIIGSKLVYWMIFPHQSIMDMKLLVSDPVEFFKQFGAGFVFFGGLFAGALTLYVFMKKHRHPIAPVLDLFTPAVPLAHAFGRIGCFLAGCCYGTTCDLPWAVTFTSSNSLAPLNIPLHPVQLYESVFLFLLTGFLVLIENKIRRIPGRLLPLYVFFYGCWRFMIEFLRGDPRGQIPGTFLSTTQGVALVAVAVSAAAFATISMVKKSSNEIK